MGLRLWHQSSTDLKNDAYREMVKRYTAKILPDATIDLHGVVCPGGEARRRIRDGAYGQMLVDLQCAHNIIQAESEGYDAVVYTCYNDPGLVEGRSMVDIPVVGLCESSILVGQTLGRRMGLIGANAAQANKVGRTIHKERLEDRVACIVPMTKPYISGYGDASDGGESILRSFEDAARTAIDRGADVLISAEGPFNIILAEMGIIEVDGIRVVDAFGAALQRARSLVELRKVTGDAITPTRTVDYVKLDRAIAEQMANCTAEVLVNGWREA